jgi:hypothetical protein
VKANVGLTGARLGTSGKSDRKGASFRPTSSTAGSARPSGAAMAAETGTQNSSDPDVPAG